MSDSGKSNPMKPSDASRIQSSEARQNSGQVSKGGFASRAQSSAATNVNKGIVPPSSGKK